MTPALVDKAIQKIAKVAGDVSPGDRSKCQCPNCPSTLHWWRGKSGTVWITCECIGPISLNIPKRWKWPGSNHKKGR